MSDSRKTKKELLTEIRALRQQLETQQQDEAGDESGDDTGQPILEGDITRRTALTSWVAPVILSVPLAKLQESAAIAQNTPARGAPTPIVAPTAPTQPPILTPVPTTPTVAPTAPTQPPVLTPAPTTPTVAPTSSPTAPTVAPTASPTAPTPAPTQPAQTPFPTVSPTSFPTASPTAVVPVELLSFTVDDEEG